MVQKERMQILQKVVRKYNTAKKNNRVFKAFKDSKISFSTLSKLEGFLKGDQELVISDLVWSRLQNIANYR